jgi:putative ABC transport system permease protein
MALGAKRSEVMTMVLRHGLRLAAVGVAAGLAAAFALTHFLSALLFGVRPFDPLTFAAVPVALTSVVIAASYLPAHRATRIDPMAALRCE